MSSNEAIKERIKYNTEKLKIVSAFIILLTGGLIGLLFKNDDSYIKIALLVGGTIIDIFAIIYNVILDDKIKNLLKTIEDKNA